MAFTLELNQDKLHWNQETLQKSLNEMATASKAELCWSFARENGIETGKLLNQLQPQVLKTDDPGLVSLFKRAVRNHDTLHPDNQAQPVRIYNKHYQPPSFLIPKTDVTLDVRDEEVIVTTKLEVKRAGSQESLVLDAYQHSVLEVQLNGALLDKENYIVTEHEIILLHLPGDSKFTVCIKSSIDPFRNKSLEGLYQSGQWLTTQCESEGARRIFPTQDRPDVLSRYTTTIIADPVKYPCRISNGNLVEETKDADGRAIITWEDPFPKPSYLFAAVMGDFGVVKDRFTTCSGREVSLEVYMEKGKENRAEFSLSALKKAMQFEEEHFDREYDLDSLKMVAIPDFNMGAMENKGLLIFNESCILVSDDCATDQDYIGVSSTISHEYCHNWSGNRVTVRNWFEIALKEAFTDFRCSLFDQWLYGNALVRPQEVTLIRERQFPEDAGSGAHPIQVDSYSNTEEIYDMTTYVKGREVFRMLQTILDSHKEDLFRVAQNRYFDRYDGQAVTFRELLGTLEEVSKIDLKQFERWFHQPGTPKVTAQLDYDEATKVAQITFKQSCPHPKTGEEQKPFHIPLYVEMLTEEGRIILPKTLLNLTEETQTFPFENIDEKPILVMHHNFCAPIRMDYRYTDTELEKILQFEEDPFARKEAGEIYLKRKLQSSYREMQETGKINVPESMLRFYETALSSDKLSPLAKAELLKLPSLRTILENEEQLDFAAAAKVRSEFQKAIAARVEDVMLNLLEKHPDPEGYEPDSLQFKEEIAVRELRNACFSYLALIPGGKHDDRIFEAYASAKNFNNQSALLEVLVENDDPRKEKVLREFYETWKNDMTILYNWIRAQTRASNCSSEVLESIYRTKGFVKENPDHLRGLIRTFVNNLGAYHSNPEENYRYVTDKILEFGEINPAVASSYLAKEAFQDFANLPEEAKAVMRKQLERLASPNVHQMIRAEVCKHLES